LYEAMARNGLEFLTSKVSVKPNYKPTRVWWRFIKILGLYANIAFVVNAYKIINNQNQNYIIYCGTDFSNAIDSLHMVFM